MNNQKDIVVLGLGEVGRPLYEILSSHQRTIGIDIAPSNEEVGEVEVMHVCYPFQIRDFEGRTAEYIAQYKPELTVINSTVSVGTTRRIAERTGTAVVNSPVRGKHMRMREELCKYVKFVGAIDEATGAHAVRHFEAAGMKAKALATPEATELAKLTETTYFGLMIAWAQELERYCDQTGANYEEVISFYEEIKFFPPVKYFPGVIGGHCVMPNIAILRSQFASEILAAVDSSNKMKIAREEKVKADQEERVTV